FPRQDPQPLPRSVFVTHVEEQLQPQTDSQKRLARGDVGLDGFDEVLPAELGDRVSKGANPGQYDLVAILQIAGARADLGRNRKFLERFLNAPQVPHAVVDDLNHSAIVSRYDTADERAVRAKCAARGDKLDLACQLGVDDNF